MEWFSLLFSWPTKCLQYSISISCVKELVKVHLSHMQIQYTTLGVCRLTAMKTKTSPSLITHTHTHKRESWPKWSMVWFYVVMDWFLILLIPILIRLNFNFYFLGRMTKHFKCTRRSLFKHRWLFCTCILSHLLV